MIIDNTKKTNWFSMAIIIFLTGASFYFISKAFYKPLVRWETYNAVRAAEIKAITE